MKPIRTQKCLDGVLAVVRTMALLRPELMNPCLIETCMLCTLSQLPWCTEPGKQLLPLQLLRAESVGSELVFPRMCGQCHQGSLQAVLETFPLVTLGVSTSLQVSIEDALGKTLTGMQHSGDVTSPVELSLAKHCIDITHLCLPKDLCVRDLVLPFHLE